MSLDPLPNADRGFEVDYTGFILPGGHEATLRIGWAPGKAGNVREKIGVKYGSCRTQIVLAGGCEAPKEKKKTAAVPAPSFPQRRAPLRSSNRVKQTNGVTGKKGDPAPAKQSDVRMPKNPVERAEGQPEFAPIRPLSDNAENVPPKIALMTARALKVYRDRELHFLTLTLLNLLLFSGPTGPRRFLVSTNRTAKEVCRGKWKYICHSPSSLGGQFSDLRAAPRDFHHG